MRELQEKKRRYNKKFAYIPEYEKWLNEAPTSRVIIELHWWSGQRPVWKG